MILLLKLSERKMVVIMQIFLLWGIFRGTYKGIPKIQENNEKVGPYKTINSEMNLCANI